MKKTNWSAIVCDAVLVVSIFVLAYGCWLAYRPAGFIVLGLLLGAVAFLRGVNIANESRQ